MTLTLEQVVPWGRSLGEYRRMFALTDADLETRILGCADGPASFNAEMTCDGRQVVSCDPLYQFSTAEIRQQIQVTSPKIVKYAQTNCDEFVWSEAIPNANALASLRMNAMDRFLLDYDLGRRDNRYVVDELPSLQFSDNTFDLALCSHFLFLYSEHLTERFHMESLQNLMRVARETRVFPLVELNSKPSRHLENVKSSLLRQGYRVEVDLVDYEFQRGANQMMRIKRQPSP